MCPLCMTNVALVVAGASSAGTLGLVAAKVRALRRQHQKPRSAQPEPKKTKQ